LSITSNAYIQLNSIMLIYACCFRDSSLPLHLLYNICLLASLGCSHQSQVYTGTPASIFASTSYMHEVASTWLYIYPVEKMSPQIAILSLLAHVDLDSCKVHIQHHIMSIYKTTTPPYINAHSRHSHRSHHSPQNAPSHLRIPYHNRTRSN
jgi:hypothetical protein